MRWVAPLVVLVGIGLSPNAWATVPKLSKATAVKQAQAAASSVGNDSAEHRPQCSRVSALRFTCTMRWADRDGDYRWRIRITITRSGPEISPVDDYVVTGTGRGSAQVRFDRIKVKERGRIVVDTRRAQLGQQLRLYSSSYFDPPKDLLVVPTIASLPAPGPPVIGTLVAVKAEIRNVGSRRVSDSFDARMILDDNTAAPPYTTDGCDPDFDIPGGETRSVCKSFDVPAGRAVKQVEWGPGSDELGIWHP